MEKETMKKLLKENMDTMFGYSYFITGNREKAMDLMQDTILNILKKKTPYREQDSFKAWIFRVLKNNHINRSKKVSLNAEINESAFETDNVISHVFEDSRATTEKISDPILRNRIVKAFSSMPDEFRDVCYLIEVEGLKYDETAEKLGIAVGTVMSRLHRGRDFLRKELVNEARELNIGKERRVRNG